MNDVVISPPTTTYVGIDPGASGGLSSLAPSHGSVSAQKMPETERDRWDWIKSQRMPGRKVVAMIEKVGGFIKGNPAPGSAMFSFGASYGGLRMALIAAGIPFEEVTPQAWQKGLGIPPRKPHTGKRKVKITKGKNKGKWREEKFGGETDGQFKNRLKARAQQLFPENEVTLAIADALLIAEFCRRKHEGILS